MTTETRSAISINETEDSEPRDAIRSDGTEDPEARSAIRSSEHHQVPDHETLDGVLNSPTRLSDEAETTVDDEVNDGTFDTLGSEVRGEANLLTPGSIHEREDESGRSVSMDRSVSEDESCVIAQNNKRQKACPGQKRRIVTVTQWDASARQQMIRQLGQRDVT